MHVDHLAGVAVGRAAAGVGRDFDRGSRPGIERRKREPERRQGLCGGRGLCKRRGFGRSGRWGQRLGVAGKADARRATAGRSRARDDSATALCGWCDRLHARRDLGP